MFGRRPRFHPVADARLRPAPTSHPAPAAAATRGAYNARYPSQEPLVSALLSSLPIEQRTLRLRDLRLYGFVAAFAAGDLLLPLAVHTVPQGGLIFLPIFFCTLLAAYRFGILAGVLTAQIGRAHV